MVLIKSEKLWALCVSALSFIVGTHAYSDPYVKADCSEHSATNDTIFTFKIDRLEGGSEIDFQEFKGKVLLIVNVATFTGFTPQYRQLNELIDTFGQENFTIIATPCNQFHLSEPAENFEILNGLKYVRPGYGFVPKFPVSSKLDVNGINESPLYYHLKEVCLPKIYQTEFYINGTDVISWTPIKMSDITGNFEKFLIGADGKARYRFPPKVVPKLLEDDISTLIEEANMTS